MGSYNYKCFASQQAVSEGDACRVVILAQQEGYRPALVHRPGAAADEQVSQVSFNGMYPNAYWYPVSGFLPAVYKDYGNFKLGKDDQTLQGALAFLARLRECCVVTKKTEDHAGFDLEDLLRTAPCLHARLANLEHGQFTEPEPQLYPQLSTVWDTLLKAIDDQQVFVRALLGSIRQLTLAVVHEHAYQALVDMTVQTPAIHWGSNDFQRFTRKVFELATESLKMYTGAFDDLPEDLRERFLKGRVGAVVYEAVTTRSGLESGLCSAFRRQLESHDVVAAFNADASGAALQSVLMPVLQDLYAIKAIDNMDLVFTPSIPMPADDGNSAGEQYAKFVAAVSEKVTHDMDQRYG